MIIVFIRTIITFVAITIAMRIMGKRQLGELELNELVVTVLIAELAANPMQDIGIPLLNGLIPIVTLLGCGLLLSGLTMHSPTARVILCGKPGVLVQNGQIVEQEMRKNRFTLDELAYELRNQSITDISKVKYAILETDGRLNTILYPAEQAVTVSQMNITVDDPGYPIIVINDGHLMEENLKVAGRDRPWLDRELMKRDAGNIRDVYLMTVNNTGQIFFAAKEASR